MALRFISGVSTGSVQTDDAFNSFQCQWIFQQIGTDAKDKPKYAIINKFSGNVLDNWAGTRIEALKPRA